MIRRRIGQKGRGRWRQRLAIMAALAVTGGGVVAPTLVTPADAALKDDKDTIAVLFSYPWNDIAEQCETTLGPNGYGYVQTSPPQEHIQGSQWWTYYQPVSYDLNSRLGTEAEFKSMIDRCNAAGVKVIADAVVNHMSGSPDGGTGFAGTEFTYFNYPGLYDETDFNNYTGLGGPAEPCDRNIENYTNRWEVQNCRLVGLSDLNTAKPEVQQKLSGYLNKLVDLGVSGFRIDAVKHMPAADVEAIWNGVNNRDDLYIVQEVIRGEGEPIAPEEYEHIGDVHEFTYARELRSSFQGNNIGHLLDDGGIGLTDAWGMLAHEDAAVFVDNHDTERNGETLSYKDGRAYQMAQAFTLAWTYGSPSIQSGYAFTSRDIGPVQGEDGMVVSPTKENGWTFTHGQNSIANMVGFRNYVRGTDINNQWTDAGNNAIAFGRGDKGFLALNNNASSLTVSLETELPDGIYYNIYQATKAADGTWSGQTVTVSGGKIDTTIDGRGAIAIRSDIKAAEECVETGVLDAPANLKATATMNSIQVTWDEASALCGGIEYVIERTQTNTGKTVTTTSPEPMINDTSLPAGTEFSYVITARTRDGQLSAASEPLTVSTEIPTGDGQRIVAGDFQATQGCGGDWDPGCAATSLAFDSASGLWSAELDIPAGEYQFKVTSGSWDENWGAWGAPGGDNITFTALEGKSTFFFFDPLTGYAFASPAESLYTLPGGWGEAGIFGCAEWAPACLGAVMFPQPDGTYQRTVSMLPVGSYQFKVARGLSWDNAWGVDGANATFVTVGGESILITFDPATEQVSVGQSNPSLPGSGTAQAYWISEDTIAWPTALAEGEDLTYSLDGYLPHLVSVTANGELSAEQKKEFPRVANGYVALKITGDAREILKGSVQVVAARNHEPVASTGVQIAGVLDDLYAGAADRDLGLTWGSGTPTLALWAPTATNVSLKLWQGDAVDPQLIPAERDDDGVWTVVGEPSWKNAQFLWSVDVFVPSVGDVVTNDVTDPYSLGLTIDSKRSVLVDLEDPASFPAAWNNNPAPLANDAQHTIYELHIRDFSISDETVRPEYRGTYMAFTEGDSDGVNHLTSLADAGMTTVHLLPSFDIASSSIPENRADQTNPEIPADAGPASEAQQAAVEAGKSKDGFNWGYDPLHWTTPEGSYATEGNQVGIARTVEYRSMVSALHDMGLRVVLDQVFNHSAASGQSENSVLDRVVPGYYQRYDTKGNVESSTCCQNVATENLMAGKMMVDSVVTWAKEYGVDGFRFDLMGHHSMENMLAVRAALDELTLEKDGVDGKSIYLYGEGWDFGEVANNALFTQATQSNVAGSGIGAFNDRLRDAVRGGGPFDEDQRTYQGFGSGGYTSPNAAALEQLTEEQRLEGLLHGKDLVRVGLAGNVKGMEIRPGELSEEIDYNGQPAAYANDPQESVNYVDAHDNETLFDNLYWKLPTDTDMDTRVRLNVLSQATVALGQSPSFWHAGVDILRSKSLDRDSYNSGDHFNLLDWSMQSNGFGRGLPIAEKNKDKWNLMAPLLENAALNPTSADMNDTYQMSLDLLKLRSSSPLFTLGSGELVKERVSFPNATDKAAPGLLVMRIDDSATASPNIDRDLDGLLVVFNASPEPITEAIDGMAGKNLVLSDIQKNGYDDVVKQVTWDAKAGSVTIPAHTAAVLVDKVGSEPTVKPTDEPTGEPTGTPTGKPTGKPTGEPTGKPTGEPTGKPTGQPTKGPGQPSASATKPGGTGGKLPNTGASVAGLVILAAVATVSGGVLVARRRAAEK
ncbi:MAG: pullulanase-type alpha-1,6-glucosidase [Ancrocorticia sp.]